MHMSTHIHDYQADVHDYTIQEICIDFKESKLIMKINLEDTTKTIFFYQLLAHHFEDVISTNKIFSLYEISIPTFLSEEKEMLEEKIQVGFPSMKINDMNDLHDLLEQESYKIYQIDATFGLWGYILSKDIQIQ